VATIGIDLGGTKILGAIVHGTDVREDTKRPTPTEGGPEQVVEAIVGIVEELGGAKGVDAIGVGAPGQVDPDDGVVQVAPNLPGWSKPVPLAQLLSDALKGVPVRVENDADAAAAGEHRAGAGKGVADVLGVMVGTGVGGGLILDGKLRRGAHGLAGEIGHVTVHADGRPCGCGGLGHLEAYAGRAAMEREARRRHAEGDTTALVEIAKSGRMKSSVFEKALDRGDAVAMELIDEAVDALGIALSSATVTIDLELVVVGGGLADRLGAAFTGRIEQAVRSRLFGSSTVRVVPSALGELAGAVGAAVLAGS
jgi:glucokinase